ncbi:MAG TPA: iron export ABC transporter permease subunit FetB [Cyanobacteria bacterium UBA11149]|nr:iron export ABC transporter permease subunit FetB [Cyanobacteria bacterium UBA11367]HBE57561.1 iron export ABC transporter permease subunit FetB [Cyanobacteria bacterium UBA11366]HBK64313.1 iron export ABC transporter permease subunit FetB [Cyanobacteria bacterium UBA11166]HBR73289.1 iron export ABC transporter permease subunit FetB [Cyanobacteria bacterium UBA11159]HBS67763.1 iron export ABC transporter permease subunit FetB [Cyanobacteria bacterium UBA11153]HBW92042.1 iron export ABC tran
MDLIQLEPIDLIWGLGMIAIAIGLSSWQRLGLELSLAMATGRMVIQLMFVGYVLAFVFALQNAMAVLMVLIAMATIATMTTRNRIGKKIPGLLPLVFGSILFCSSITLIYTNLLIIQPETWYQPQYLIPLAGIVLGNAMNGAALAGERLVSTISSSRVEIETHLSLGATPQEAVAGYRKEAIRAGLIPTLNQMTVAGVVTLPGIITGQMLSGIDPLNAASYQILIMLMIALTNLTITMLITQGLIGQFFNHQSQLRLP